MKRFAVGMMSALVITFGFAGAASAQETETEVEVEVGTPDVEPGGEIQVNISGGAEGEAGTITVGDQTVDWVVDADGNAAVTIVAPETAGEVDGIVVLSDGTEIPFSVLVAALSEDGTAAPTVVNTGDASGFAESAPLYAAAVALVVLAGGAMALRRRTVDA